MDLVPMQARFDEPLFVLGGTAVTVASVVSFCVFVAAAYGASWLLRRSLQRVYRRRELDEGLRYALDRLLHYAVMATGAFLALDNLGVSVSALAGLGAVLAVGIGFGLQNIAQNFVSGVILLLERPVKKGDFVHVGEVRGTVRDIRARATVVTTLDNVDIIVPNGQFIAEPVTNATLDDRRVRVRIAVGVAYGSETERVRDILREVASANPAVLAHPEPQVLFQDFGESSLDFVLLAWLGDPREESPVASELRFAIDRAFRAAGIEIPFPQRDLHLRTGLAPPGAPDAAGPHDAARP
jgi:small-conductance mechanosensitive channel